MIIQITRCVTTVCCIGIAVRYFDHGAKPVSTTHNQFELGVVCEPSLLTNSLGF